MSKRVTYLELGQGPDIDRQGHVPEGQAITTRYFAKKQNELKQTVLSFAQL